MKDLGSQEQKVAFKYTVTGADETTKIYVDSKGYEYELDKETAFFM